MIRLVSLALDQQWAYLQLIDNAQALKSSRLNLNSICHDTLTPVRCSSKDDKHWFKLWGPTEAPAEKSERSISPQGRGFHALISPYLALWKWMLSPLDILNNNENGHRHKISTHCSQDRRAIEVTRARPLRFTIGESGVICGLWNWTAPMKINANMAPTA